VSRALFSPPDRTGQVWAYKDVRWLIVASPSPSSVGIPCHRALCLDSGVETTVSEASLRGCARLL